MLPPQPQASLPTPQNFTFQGFCRPFCRRSFDIGLSPLKFTYCTQSASSCTGAAAHIAGQVRLGAQQFAHIQEIVGTKAVVFGNAAPPVVYNRRALVFRANAIFPVVGIGKTAAGPAQVRDFQFFQRIYHIVAYAAGYWVFWYCSRPHKNRRKYSGPGARQNARKYGG